MQFVPMTAARTCTRQRKRASRRLGHKRGKCGQRASARLCNDASGRSFQGYSFSISTSFLNLTTHLHVDDPSLEGFHVLPACLTMRISTAIDYDWHRFFVLSSTYRNGLHDSSAERGTRMGKLSPYNQANLEIMHYIQASTCSNLSVLLHV
jgi:hypothetical protein